MRKLLILASKCKKFDAIRKKKEEEGSLPSQPEQAGNS
jgi:hypothetical protein